jgi:ribosome-associated translation inhibitor RaiA
MAKTIKEIAEEIGVSKQAVFKKINQVPLSTEIEKFISTVNGKKLVSVDGEILIKQAFQRKQKRKQKTVDVNVDAKDDGKKFTVGDMVDGIPSKSQEQENTLAAAFQTAIDALTRQLEEKDRQLAEKDKLLEWQTKTIEELATSLAVAQHTAQAAQALHAGTLQRQIEDVPIMQAEEMKVATETAEEIMPEYEKRRSIFSRIFGGR